ncbi:MAG: hypothetical protein KZQ66_11620 [Candidatus Thiodiazotropha sp. (ex Lucinoma aequizonata)]|nr:hypothetical protein [Candidatus Thiodiazotropha sp. (ex Lucinoma aequizonata)]MCU7894677.1 hypothetical protein [Candidatus Thiodiazotropha sp. (ex Lucinoma aequizonata)]MCU7898602.1 hypothetical protein [Candidatus Thiodiazotropha sp. (ex Lucinoma aequizonata)]MCU7902560.1 hypothetical protein [Candidatus Thiodiazotropha sp. (ex Lucinoma aequizonata)]MCU7912174.1 hypothetical protein [Candidatus Thiodiazotropha sp. (ex Lucinoma aequizonata)]
MDLVNRIAQLMKAAERQSGADGASLELMLKLQDETRRHFRDEKAFMHDHDYPAQTSHHREHALLQAELRDLVREIVEEKRVLDFETLISRSFK